MKTLKNIIIFIFFYLIQQVPTLLMSLSILNKSKNKFLILVSMIVVPIIMIYAYKKYNKQNKSPLNKKSWMLIFLAIIATIIVNVVTIPFMKQTGNTNVDALEKIMNGFPQLMILYAVLVGPILEEILFRGLFINMFFSDSKFLGLIFSSIFFGIMHTASDPIYVISKIILGFILGLVYIKTKNIKSDIFVHIVNNLSAVFY